MGSQQQPLPLDDQTPELPVNAEMRGFGVVLSHVSEMPVKNILSGVTHLELLAIGTAMKADAIKWIAGTHADTRAVDRVCKHVGEKCTGSCIYRFCICDKLEGKCT